MIVDAGLLVQTHKCWHTCIHNMLEQSITVLSDRIINKPTSLMISVHLCMQTCTGSCHMCRAYIRTQATCIMIIRTCTLIRYNTLVQVHTQAYTNECAIFSLVIFLCCRLVITYRRKLGQWCRKNEEGSETVGYNYRIRSAFKQKRNLINNKLLPAHRPCN